jgi:single-strand DNA-binding protein
MYINKVILFGNLTRDPELRALSSGMNMVNLRLATNRTFKDRDGKKQEQAEFHDVVVFGRQADVINQYLRKGSSALIEGRLQTRSWEDKKTGEKKYRTEIVADHVEFGPKSSGSSSYGSTNSSHTISGQSDNRYSNDEVESGETSASGIDYPKEDINPDDIPF